MTLDTDGTGNIAAAREYESYDNDEDITLSTTYTNVLPVNAQFIRESVIQFTNKGTVSLTYKIFGSAKKGQKFKTLNPEIDDRWINLLSTGTYAHTTEITIPLSVLALGTVTCVSAIAGDTVTVNGLLYTAVAGAKANDTQFSIDTSDNATATDLADSIDDDTRTGITVTTVDVTATATTNVVTILADETGDIGNNISLVSSNGTRLAVSGALFTTGFSARSFETFSNPWRYVIVMVKAASGTPTVKIWHRGEN